ncbi:MAG: phosphotransferase family protein [Mycetocola sp.]
MNTEPDGAEVVQTAEEAVTMCPPPLLIIDALRRYFEEHDLGEGDLAWQRIGEGQANLTYLIRRGDQAFVLRRGPRPPHPPSTHDMIREARVQRLIAAAGVATPNIVSVCEDPAVLGVPFYVMDYLDGVVITNHVPPHLDTLAERRSTGLAAVDALVALHELDVTSGELATIGRPDGYLERQVRRFSGLWEQTTERSLSEVPAVGRWLAGRIPRSQKATVVHGDYRIGNLMYDKSTPARVMAILDWEMATLGDPLTDLGYLTATYAQPDSTGTPIELTSVTREPGYPDRDELMTHYGKATGLDVGHLAWYQVLALWKASIFCEAIYTRWLHGERLGDSFAPTLAEGIPAMIWDALQIIERAER